MTTATVGERYQIVIPKPIRQRVKLEPHSKVHVSIEGSRIVITALREGGFRGIGKELSDGGDVLDYVRKLRSEWETRQ